MCVLASEFRRDQFHDVYGWVEGYGDPVYVRSISERNCAFVKMGSKEEAIQVRNHLYGFQFGSDNQTDRERWMAAHAQRPSD